MAEIKTVGSGKDFTTIQAGIDWFAAQGSLIGTGENQLVCDPEVYTENPTVNALVTDATGYLRIIAASGTPIITPSGNTHGVRLNRNFCTLEGFEVYPLATFTHTILINPSSASTKIMGCTIRNPNAVDCHGIYGSNTTNDTLVTGTSVHGFNGASKYGVRYVDTVTETTAYGCRNGIGNVGTATDNYSGECTFDYGTITTKTFCASEDTSGNAGLQNIDPANEFVNATGGDFRLVTGSALLGTGSTGNNIGQYQGAGVAPLPSLTSPSVDNITQTTADAHITTDTANGTLYMVVSESASVPDDEQIQDGLDGDGLAGVFADNQSITTTGVKTFNVTGLSPLTNYYVYFQQQNAALADSVVVASNLFQTLDIVRPIITSVGGDDVVLNGETVTIVLTDGGAVEGTVTLAGEVQAVTGWADTSISFTVSQVAYAYGSQDIVVTDSGGVASQPHTIDVQPPAGKKVVTANNPLLISPSLFTKSTPTGATSDQIEYDAISNLGHNISVSTDGTFSSSGGGTAQQTFSYRGYDASAQKWYTEIIAKMN